MLSAGRPATETDARAAVALEGLLTISTAIIFLTFPPASAATGPLGAYATFGLAALLTHAGTWAVSSGTATTWTDHHIAEVYRRRVCRRHRRRAPLLPIPTPR